MATGSCRPVNHPATGRDVAALVVSRHGTTLAEEAGIRLRNTPSPLYRLLVLATLLSARISSDLAVSAARELAAAGLRSPAAMRAATWQQRVDVLGRGGYRRYDERTATRLGDGADLVISKYRGDLRRLRAPDDRAVTSERLQEFPGIGPTGATIFCREVQGLWPELAPTLDRKVLDGAQRMGLPTSAEDLGALVEVADLPRLAAGCVRATRRREVASDILAVS